MANKWRQPIQVQMAHTDCTGVVYHAHYLDFMELARSKVLEKACQQNAMSTTQFYENYGFFVVRSVTINYRQPLRLSDQVTVVSEFTSQSPVRMMWQQDIMSGSASSERLCADARVELAFVGKNMRPKKTPEWLWSLKTEVSE